MSGTPRQPDYLTAPLAFVFMVAGLFIAKWGGWNMAIGSAIGVAAGLQVGRMLSHRRERQAHPR